MILGIFATFFFLIFTDSLYFVTLKWILKTFKPHFLEGPEVSGSMS